MDDDLGTLYERSEAGLRWLAAHDDDGNFHLWYEANIRPGVPMPAQGDEVRARYAEYHKARALWERIETRIKQLEAKRG